MLNLTQLVYFVRYQVSSYMGYSTKKHIFLILVQQITHPTVPSRLFRDRCIPYYPASIRQLTFPFDIVHKHYFKFIILLLRYFFIDGVSILSFIHSAVSKLYSIILSTVGNSHYVLIVLSLYQSHSSMDMSYTNVIC